MRKSRGPHPRLAASYRARRRNTCFNRPKTPKRPSYQWGVQWYFTPEATAAALCRPKYLTARPNRSLKHPPKAAQQGIRRI